MMKAHYIRDNFWPLHLALFHEIFAFLISENFAKQIEAKFLHFLQVNKMQKMQKILRNFFFRWKP